jgi:hypothetical protein
MIYEASATGRRVISAEAMGRALALIASLREDLGRLQEQQADDENKKRNKKRCQEPILSKMSGIGS